MTNPIEISVADQVQTIRLNRPDKKNAITGAMYKDMAAAVNSAKADSNIRATLFLGVPGAFSAGNDINDLCRSP